MRYTSTLPTPVVYQYVQEKPDPESWYNWPTLHVQSSIVPDRVKIEEPIRTDLKDIFDKVITGTRSFHSGLRTSCIEGVYYGDHIRPTGDKKSKSLFVVNVTCPGVLYIYYFKDYWLDSPGVLLDVVCNYVLKKD